MNTPLFPASYPVTVKPLTLKAEVPNIRSSDYGLLLSDPFRYYLCRRLGLVPAFSYQEALAMGSWVHARFEYIQHDLDDDSDTGDKYFLEYELDRVKKENEVTAKEVGVSDSKLADVNARAEKDAQVALAWYHGASTVEMGDKGTFLEYLNKPEWEILGSELLIRTTLPDMLIPNTIAIDLLLYNHKKEAIYILDLKTCSKPALLRAASCPIEFQTWHYTFSLENELSNIIKDYNLPTDTKLGGMFHLIMQKPNISYGQSDRDYWYESAENKKGFKGTVTKKSFCDDWFVVCVKDVDYNNPSMYSSPDLATACEWLREQGCNKPKKMFSGEPNPLNYRQRCHDWYHGEGDSIEKSVDWAEGPPVNLSFTNGKFVLDKELRQRYYSRVRFIEAYAVCLSNPDLFFESPQGIYEWNKLSQYAPFYLRPKDEWPEIIRIKKFVVARRG